MKIRTGMALLAVLSVTTIAATAQGADIYKTKCQMCHGATGMADSPAGKSMKVKPISDPEVKKFTEAEMIAATKNGMGKMKPYKDKLTDAQIKDAVAYFRTFLK
ncbi:cytochrome c [Acidobacteria bacterium AB60]|nr:cytochrome c [Acidobacteria bacterium AB60]